ncbi:MULTISPECIES: ABC transporter substrate-binding protein [unclassified Nocardioides]|uniref:ABC transporter substrate-binding protein n=1 Tax=Nocardioides sp. URHA0032 TaxID=1380388 RepID=UPI0005601450|nr:ABC transporter substrate-binding protein [Nocardioides sp. URHA0032]
MITTTTRARLAAVAAALALPLAAAACTGDGGGGSNDNPDADVTITFWHGWSADSEVAAIQATVDAFEKANPNIHVNVVGNITDDKINQALRAGGSNAPDVVSSFTTDNVGQFCTSGAFVDLGPLLDKAGIDPESTFPAAQLEYTQYQGDQCALPLLGDAYGLYYNKDAFAAAGIAGPPKTLSEFDADAVKLTKTSGDTYSQLGFMPDYHGYESTITHFAAQWSPEYFDADGASNVAADPAFKDTFEWQLGLVNKLGGYDRLEKYRTTFGDEFGAKNPFMTGQVAMAIDGEWRAGMIQADAPDLNFGVAPFPVPDDQADQYGKGYITGTIVGIASTSEKQNAAWRFVQFLTTDTKAVVDFANAIHNVPSTKDALASPDVSQDPAFQTFVAIASDPNSNTTPASPNGGAYQLTLQDLGYDIESGKQTDIQAGLEDAAHQIDTELEQSK